MGDGRWEIRWEMGEMIKLNKIGQFGNMYAQIRHTWDQIWIKLTGLGNFEISHSGGTMTFGDFWAMYFWRLGRHLLLLRRRR